jgi:NAD(P)-dependent dehydrogenase (short-subunit alcohol dehydrogenase family)
MMHEAKTEDLRRELEVNLLGPMLVSRRALRSMRALGRGDIVFVTSLNAVAPRPLQTGYTASKAGLEGVARVLRMELEGTGIRSTIVRPGPTISDFAQQWPEGALERAADMWRDWSLWRHDVFLPPASVAAAIVSAVTAPTGTHIDEIQINPVAPVGRGKP